MFKRFYFLLPVLFVVFMGIFSSFSFAESGNSAGSGRTEKNSEEDAIKPDDWNFSLEDGDKENGDEFKFIQENESLPENSSNDTRLWYAAGIALILLGFLGITLSIFSVASQIKKRSKRRRTRS
ncbi:MAG: hypothetical protein LBH37_02145 [Oscillospiraceae bacterium]|nr:hypothetical protein [Oscillospiraceae bacterium]